MVAAATASRGARRAAAPTRPDLLILDVRMPGLAGDEVCRRIKSDPDAEFLPVILVTAYEESGARLRALEAGADDLLIAPVNRLELLARVRSLLRLELYHQDLVRHESVVLSLSAALEAKDAYTRGHSQRVGELSAAPGAPARARRRVRGAACGPRDCSTTSARSRCPSGCCTSRGGSTRTSGRWSWPTR